MALNIEYYQGNEVEWDDFVCNKSMNGTFLQTRKFINYHAEGKFKDCSICIRKGNELVAAILACVIEDNGKIYFGHKGTTFGGITISEKIYSATIIDEMFKKLHEFLVAEGFEKIYLKMVPEVYQKKDCSLLDYFLYKNGYTCFSELNYLMQMKYYKEDVISQFSSSKRRDYRYSLKNDLIFRKLETREEIAEYHLILQANLKKLDLPLVHSLEDFYDLKYNRFESEMEFYGVFLENKMVAGSVVFIFDDHIFHTQYLSSYEEYLKMYPMDYLITNLIQTAVDRKMDTFTFGICTEDQGRYLNLGLSRFKEGFGTEFCINRSYEKELI